MSSLIIPLLVSMILLVCYAQKGGELSYESRRLLYWQQGGIVLLALLAPNKWLSGLMLLPLVPMGHNRLPRVQREPYLYATLVWGALYVLISPFMTKATIPMVLWAFVAVGAIQGLWTAHTLLVMRTWPYQVTYHVLGYPLVTLSEAFHTDTPLQAGCGNSNHAYAISGVAVAANIDLQIAGYWYALFLLPLCGLYLVWHFIKGDAVGEPTAAHAYAVALFLAVLPLMFGLYGVGVACILIFSGSWIVYSHPKWLSGRWQHWLMTLDDVWKQGWRTQLFGNGSGSWMRTYCQQQFNQAIREHKSEQELLTNPHNEYIAMLYEHGYVGLVILCGYLATSFYTAANAGPLGIGVFLIGAVLCTCAAVLMPWVVYMEVITPAPVPGQLCITGVGSPALNILSFATVLMVEGLTK